MLKAIDRSLKRFQKEWDSTSDTRGCQRKHRLPKTLARASLNLFQIITARLEKTIRQKSTQLKGTTYTARVLLGKSMKLACRTFSHIGVDHSIRADVQPSNLEHCYIGLSDDALFILFFFE